MTPYFANASVSLFCGDVRQVLRHLPDASAQTCVTSPPYFGLRDYGVDGQIGLEQTPDAYVSEMVAVFREVRRVLKDDGTLWLNLGDSYANDGKWGGSTGGKHASGLHGNTGVGRERKFTGMKPKDLIGIPWRVAFALQSDGWYLRQDIIWHKPNPMPESVRDRCTKAHEYVFLLSKSERYYFDYEAIREQAVKGHAGSSFDKGKTAKHQLGRASTAERKDDGLRTKRSVWSVSVKPYKGAHFATFPADLIEPCILAGAPRGGTVLEPFSGSGTTLAVADKHGRKAVGIELNPKYCDLAVARFCSALE